MKIGAYEVLVITGSKIISNTKLFARKRGKLTRCASTIVYSTCLSCVSLCKNGNFTYYVSQFVF